VARTSAIGFPDCTWHEDSYLPGGDVVFINDVTVGFFKFRQIERGAGQKRSLAYFDITVFYGITHISLYIFIPQYKNESAAPSREMAGRYIQRTRAILSFMDVPSSFFNGLLQTILKYFND
jgi:hypothetical protein